jgi:outer membrane protein assembly factor BamB
MAPGGDTLLLLCLDRATGKIVWTREIDEGNTLHRKHNSSSPSPVTDGEHVWVLTGNGALRCYDVNGTRQWSRNLQEDYGRFGLNHGYGSSPVLAEGRLYLVNESATTVVVSAKPEFEILATNSLDDSYTLASPVVVANQLFLRTGEHLYCLAEPGNPSSR